MGKFPININPIPSGGNMTTATGSYSFDIDSEDVKRLGVHPKSNLMTIVVQGACTDKEGNTFNFVARNNLDLRYPERFKVNWNGSKPRLPVEVGTGFDDETKEGRVISDGLYMTRGARIAIARKCIALFPLVTQMIAVEDDEAPEEE